MLAAIITLSLFRSPILKIIDALHMLHLRYFFITSGSTALSPITLFFFGPCSLTEVQCIWSYFLAGVEFWPICSVFLRRGITYPHFKAHISLSAISEFNYVFPRRADFQGSRWHQQGWPRTNWSLFYPIDPEPLPLFLPNRLYTFSFNISEFKRSDHARLLRQCNIGLPSLGVCF